MYLGLNYSKFSENLVYLFVYLVGDTCIVHCIHSQRGKVHLDWESPGHTRTQPPDTCSFQNQFLILKKNVLNIKLTCSPGKSGRRDRESPDCLQWGHTRTQPPDICRYSFKCVSNSSTGPTCLSFFQLNYSDCRYIVSKGP